MFIDADAAVGRLGPPLDVELARWFPDAHVSAAADLFRSLYSTCAIEVSPALPGAVGAMEMIRDQGGRIIVITGKYEANARLHLDHLGLTADGVVGWAWAEGKTAAMVSHGARVYVGDHPADMMAARAVPDSGSGRAAAVGVATGLHGATELLAAGADAVLMDLTEFPRWLDEHQTPGPISVGLGLVDR